MSQSDPFDVTAANAPVGAAPVGAAPVRQTPDAWRVLVTLLRRELWEHPALWRAPLAIAILLALAAIVAVTTPIEIDGRELTRIDADARVMALNLSQDAWALLIYLVAMIVTGFYTLDCLYTERKDRSILFWKSLPVSDRMTVLAKFLIAAVVVPLLVFALAVVSHLVALIIFKLRIASGHAPQLVAWDTVAWLRGLAFIALCLLLASLWYAPLIAAGMLVSAAVRRNPLLWATLPLVVVPILEYILLRTRYVWNLLSYRSAGIWETLAVTARPIDRHAKLLRDLNWGGVLGDVDLWLGLLVAGVILYAAVRIRRYQDDT